MRTATSKSGRQASTAASSARARYHPTAGTGAGAATACGALKAFERRARDTILTQHGVPTDSAAWGLSKVVDHWVIEREYAYIAHGDPLPEPLRDESRRRAYRSYLSLHDDLMAQLADVRQRLAAA